MTLLVEAAVLCALFTLPILAMSKDPLKTLYNYPPKIQQRVKSLPEYDGRVPTRKKKIAVKLTACLLFIMILSLVLRYINKCVSFPQAFLTGFLLWTAVNLFDLVVLDILWFCHDPRFVLPGTEDMVSDYHDYGFHLRGFFIGEGLALAVCCAAALVVRYLL